MIQHEFFCSVLSDLIVKACSLTETSRTGKPIFSPDWFLLCNMGGKLRIAFENENGDVLDVRQSEAVFIAPYTAAKYKGDGRICCIEFEGRFMRRLTEDFRAVNAMKPGTLSISLIERLFQSSETDERFLSLSCCSVILSVLSEMGSGSVRERRRITNESVTDRIVNYFSENYDKNINIADICRDFGISLSSFNKLMIKRFGVSPRQYLINFRMSKAKELLKNTDNSVESVARFVGYEYCGHFCNEFKKKVGLTPLEYRNKIYI